MVPENADEHVVLHKLSECLQSLGLPMNLSVALFQTEATGEVKH